VLVRRTVTVCRAEVGRFLVWQLRLRFLGHQILRPNRRLSRQSSRPPIQCDLRERESQMCVQDRWQLRKWARRVLEKCGEPAIRLRNMYRNEFSLRVIHVELDRHRSRLRIHSMGNSQNRRFESPPRKEGTVTKLACRRNSGSVILRNRYDERWRVRVSIRTIGVLPPALRQNPTKAPGWT